MAVILLVLVYIISSRAGKMAAGLNVKAGGERPVVVIDAGQPDPFWGREAGIWKPRSTSLIFHEQRNQPLNRF